MSTSAEVLEVDSGTPQQLGQGTTYGACAIRTLIVVVGLVAVIAFSAAILVPSQMMHFVVSSPPRMPHIVPRLSPVTPPVPGAFVVSGEQIPYKMQPIGNWLEKRPALDARTDAEGLGQPLARSKTISLQLSSKPVPMAVALKDSATQQRLEEAAEAMEDPVVKQMVQLAASRAPQSNDIHQNLNVLREDLELKPMLDEMEKNVLAARKYSNNPELLRKVGQLLGEASCVATTSPVMARSLSSMKPDGSFFDPSVRTPARTVSIACVWAGLVAYVVLGAPGKDELHQALDSELLQKLIANPFDESVAPLFAVIFNFMGIWPAWYAAALLPGAKNQKPVPAAPFLFGSVAAGMFALSPYLSLREYRGEGSATKADLNGIGRWFEGKLNGALLAGGAVGLTAMGLSANGGDLSLSLSEYKALFDSQLFVHVTTLDFLALWLYSFSVMAEDMERRGMDSSKAPLFCAAPILGHCSYLLLREPLPEE